MGKTDVILAIYSQKNLNIHRRPDFAETSMNIVTSNMSVYICVSFCAHSSCIAKCMYIYIAFEFHDDIEI